MAGTLESLKFDVILKDTDFKTRIKEDIKLANDLNTSLSNVIKIQGTRQIISSAGVKNAQSMVGYLTQIDNKIRNMPKGQFLVGDADRLNATLSETNKKLDQILAKSQKAGKSMGGLGGSLNRIWLRFTATLWSVISAVRLFTRTVGSAIKNISNFQQANANLATIMQVSRKEIEVLTNDALMLGRTTEWTASQVTELQTALAKLGYDIPQIRNMQASVLQFATAVGAKLPDAANLAGAALRMFGMHSSEMQKALEILTASTNKTALDFEKLKVSLPYVGAIAHSIGFDIAETASLLGVLTNAGLESSRAGTGLRQVLLELSKEGGKLQTAMGGNIKTFDDFVNGLQGMRDRGLQAGEATKLVSTRASSALLILANGVDTIRKLNDEVRDTDGLLKTIQSERLDTLHGSALLLKSAWEGLIQTFRDSAGPMKNIVDWLTKIVRATSLAASRANRVAQGTKDVIGSDQLTKQFQEQFDSLIESGKTPEAAAEIVQTAMNNWLNSAMANNKNPGIEETKWYNWLTHSLPLAKWITKGVTRKDRAAGEQVDAMKNTMDAVGDYMANRAKEEADIAANNFLEEWKLVFDTKGEKAARKAMNSVAGYDDIKSRMEVYIASGGASGANDRGKGSETAAEKARKKLIDDLKGEATYLRKLYDAFEKLVPYLGEEGAAAKMVGIFGEGEYSEKNIEDGILAITDALRSMGEEGKEAAESIEQSMGLDRFSQTLKQLKDEKKAADDAQKALEKYHTTLRKWQSEDFNLGGSGFEFDINKVISDLNTNLGKVDEKYIQAVEQAKEAHKGNADAINEEIEKLKELRDAEKDYVRAKAQESLNDLAQSYLKDQYFLRGINLDHLGELSISQLRRLRKELEDVGKDALRMGHDFDGLEQTLASWGLDVNNLTEEDIESLKDRLPESVIEMVRLMKATKDAGLSFDMLNQKIQSAIKKGLQNLEEEEKKAIIQLGKYAAKQVLELADAFGELGEAIGNANLQAAGNMLKGIGDMASSVAQGLSQGGLVGGAIALVVGSVKGIISDMANDAKEAAEATEKWADAQRSYNRELEKTAIASQSTIFGTNKLGQLREYLSLFKKYKNLLDNFGKGAADAAERRSTEALLRSAGFLDSNGNLVIEKIKSAIESGSLTGETAKNLESAIEAYEDAEKGIEEIAESLVGSVVGDVADKIVDSWWEAGEAALDYTDILGDVAKAYAKLIVQDMLLDAAFDGPKREQFINALKSGDASTAMSVVNQAMQSAVDMLPVINQALQAFEPYRQMASEGSESNSVGSGIKSITEDTANLLASYINAISADVSVIRGLQEKHLGSIGESLPTLNDYLAQCAANTYDVAQSNQSILSEIRSVIGAPGTSGMVVRVETA